MTRHSVTLYGLKSCDSCRKARAWLRQHEVDVHFHDLRADGVPADRLPVWLHALGWQQVLNRRSTTWRQLGAATRDGVTDADRAAALLLAHPSAIKRPLVQWSSDDAADVTVGLVPQAWSARLGQ